MTTEVTITDAGFEPPTVTIAISDTVRWTNRGASVHAVAGGAPRRRYLPLVLR
jgi:plastocyanin